MSKRKLWKIISISKRRGSRISKSAPYGECLERFHRYRKDLEEGDILYMIQVLEVAVGREAALSVGMEEINIDVPAFAVR